MVWSNFGLRTKIFSALFPVLAALLSGVLLVLAFPDYNFSWFAWVGLVPLLLSLYGKRPVYGYVLCFIFSTVFFSGVCIWIFEAQKYTLIHHALVMLFLGAPLALFGLVFCFISKRLGGVIAFVAAPCIWVALEYVRANLSFLALPWGFLAHSQSQNIPFIQIVDITGAYGISFLVVMVNASLASTILAFTGQTSLLQPKSSAPPTRKAGARRANGRPGCSRDAGSPPPPAGGASAGSTCGTARRSSWRPAAVPARLTERGRSNRSGPEPGLLPKASPCAS